MKRNCTNHSSVLCCNQKHLNAQQNKRGIKERIFISRNFLKGLMVIFLFAATAYLNKADAATKTWVGGTLDFNAASNWSPASIPGPTDDIVINVVGANISLSA